MARYGRSARHTGDFVAIVQDWLKQLPRSFEPGRYVVKLDQFRDWYLKIKALSLRTFQQDLLNRPLGTHAS